jgi:hypothetical protein
MLTKKAKLPLDPLEKPVMPTTGSDVYTQRMQTEAAGLAADKISKPAPVVPASNAGINNVKIQQAKTQAMKGPAGLVGAPVGGPKANLMQPAASPKGIGGSSSISVAPIGANISGLNGGGSSNPWTTPTDGGGQVGGFGLRIDGNGNPLNPGEIPAATGSPSNPGTVTSDNIQQTGDVQRAAEAQLLALLNGGQRDTSEEEALVEQMMQRTIGKGQADLNARMGASGFGTSGALGAMTGDLRSQAAMNAAQQVQNIRGDSRDDFLARISQGLGAADRNRQRDNEEIADDRMIELINALFGGDEPTALGPSGRGEDDFRTAPLAPEGSQTAANESQFASVPWKDVDYTPPQGSVQIGEDNVSIVYQLPDGSKVRVAKHR